MDKTTHTLQEMHDLLSDPRRWTQGELARDQYGRWCPPLSADARCWCMIGAFRKATALPEAIVIDTGREPVFRLLRAAIDKHSPFDGFVSTNDETDHDTVMKVIGVALEKSKEMKAT